MKTIGRAGAIAAASICIASVAMSGAQATPAGPGPAPNLPTSTAIAAGTLDGPVTIKQDGIKLVVENTDATVRSFDLTYPVGTYSGWHQHPGIVVAVVESGKVSRQLKGCGVTTFVAGQSFYETGPHFVWNPDPTVPAKLKITQIYPAGELPRAETDQLCPMPVIPPVAATS